MILCNDHLTIQLGDIIDNLQDHFTPKRHKISNAFSYAEPSTIRVVIIGTSPAATDNIASGLAFSSDRNERQFRKKQAVPRVHEALRGSRRAENGENLTEYYCGHQEWAKNGVLLLNAALTIIPSMLII